MMCIFMLHTYYSYLHTDQYADSNNLIIVLVEYIKYFKLHKSPKIIEIMMIYVFKMGFNNLISKY